MTATINASTTAGVVTTADTSGILQLQTNGTAALTIDASANVGIGTASPSTKLHINNASTSATYLRAENNNGFALFGVDAGGAAYAGAESSDAFGLVTNGTYRVYIDSSGNVGIGTTSPAGKLAVSDGTVIGEINPFSAASGCYIGTRSNHAVLFQVNASEKARIDSSGNLLVGGTSTFASSKVVIECPSGTQSVAFGIASNVVRTGSTQYGYSLYRDNVDETNAVTFVENGSTGNNAASYVVRTNSGTGGGGVTNVSGGVALVQGATSWSSYSDLRLKHDVVPVTNAIESILKIDPIFFKWDDRPEDQRRSIGVSAQSVEKVFPELIDRSGVYDLEGGAMQVRYTELIPVLLKAIQEQQALITALTTRITALEST